MSRKVLAIVLGALMVTSASAQEWATAVSKHLTQDRSIIFRYVSKFAPTFDRAKQPERVTINWNYESKNGMPSADVRQRMDELENILKPVVETDDFSTLALVSTGENSREWIYYTSSSELFIEKLNEALKDQPPFPIEIRSTQDPSWNTYEEFLSGLENGHG